MQAAYARPNCSAVGSTSVIAPLSSPIALETLDTNSFSFVDCTVSLASSTTSLSLFGQTVDREEADSRGQYALEGDG
eukprot:scaffold15059_cov146-Skeletonema_menzelii.AAC.3